MTNARPWLPFIKVTSASSSSGATPEKKSTPWSSPAAGKRRVMRPVDVDPLVGIGPKQPPVGSERPHGTAVQQHVAEAVHGAFHHVAVRRQVDGAGRLHGFAKRRVLRRAAGPPSLGTQHDQHALAAHGRGNAERKVVVIMAPSGAGEFFAAVANSISSVCILPSPLRSTQSMPNPWSGLPRAPHWYRLSG